MGSTSIIITSNGSPVDSWAIQPTVLLAILSSIMTGASAFVLSAGVSITWWRSALHGTSLARLHLIWDRGGWFSRDGPRCDPFSGWAVSKVAFGSLVVAVAGVINNPLLQRATRIRSHSSLVEQTVMLDILQQVPDGYTGTMEGGQYVQSSALRRSMNEWYRNVTITTHNETGYTCSGTCEGVVRGAGLSVECSSSTLPNLDLLGAQGQVIFLVTTNWPW